MWYGNECFCFNQYFISLTLIAINNVMVINKKDNKKYKFVKVNFVRTVFLEVFLVVSLVSSHITTESSIILPTYLPFLQLQVEGFQKWRFSHARCPFRSSHSHWQLLLFHFWFELHFLLSTYIHICMIYILLRFLIRLFLLLYLKYKILNLLFHLEDILY